MKRTGLILLGIFFFCLSNLLAAEQSNHVPGEILLRLKPGTDVRAWAVQHQYFQQKPTQFTFREVVVAQPMQVLLFTFNFTAVDEHEFLNHLRKDKAVIAAQFNHLSIPAKVEVPRMRISISI